MKYSSTLFRLTSITWQSPNFQETSKHNLNERQYAHILHGRAKNEINKQIDQPLLPPTEPLGVERTNNDTRYPQ